LQFAVELVGGKVDESAVEEIRTVDSLRTGEANAVKILSQSTDQSNESLNNEQLPRLPIEIYEFMRRRFEHSNNNKRWLEKLLDKSSPEFSNIMKQFLSINRWTELAEDDPDFALWIERGIIEEASALLKIYFPSRIPSIN
jgi:hypothetical protein